MTNDEHTKNASASAGRRQLFRESLSEMKGSLDSFTTPFCSLHDLWLQLSFQFSYGAIWSHFFCGAMSVTLTDPNVSIREYKALCVICWVSLGTPKREPLTMNWKMFTSFESSFSVDILWKWGLSSTLVPKAAKCSLCFELIRVVSLKRHNRTPTKSDNSPVSQIFVPLNQDCNQPARITLQKVDSWIFRINLKDFLLMDFWCINIHLRNDPICLVNPGCQWKRSYIHP